MNWFHRKDFQTWMPYVHGIDEMNIRLKKITGIQKTFQLNDSKIKTFGLGGSHHLIENKLEGQLHSGKFLEAPGQLVHSMGVTNINTGGSEENGNANGRNPDGNQPPVSFEAEQVLICTNAFAKSLLPELDVCRHGARSY